MISKVFLVADKVLIDSQTNNVSIIDLLEEISPVNLPISIFRFSILHLVERSLEEPEEIQIKFIVSMNDEVIFQQEVAGNFLGKIRHRHVLILQGTTVSQPGTLTVTAEHEDEEIGRYDILVNPPPTTSEVE